jgi:hypothetical protein
MVSKPYTRYILTEDVLKRRFLSRGFKLPLVCSKCNGTINIGDSIIRKRRKVYHQECWENSFIDIPDNLDSADEFFIEYGFYPTSSITTSSTITINLNTQNSSNL